MNRVAAIALPVSVVMFIVSTAVFHPHRENPMDNAAVFIEYAQNIDWVVIHFAQWIASMLLCGGLAALYHCIPQTSSAVSFTAARFALFGTYLTAAGFTMLQAVDGVALKWAVDAWAAAPEEQKESLFAAALALRWTEYSLQSYSNIVLGLTVITFAIAMSYKGAFPRWLGWIASVSGVAWIVHGSMVPFVGLFDSIPRLLAISLFALWSFVLPSRLWRSDANQIASRT